ncbi:MAG: hypothetical protein U0350_19775 [Caldilineaceae bacterium]
MAFTVREFHDLVELLEKEPAWRAEVRRLVLTEDILGLPQALRNLAETVDRFAENTNKRFEQVDSDIQSLSTKMDQRFEQVDQQFGL